MTRIAPITSRWALWIGLALALQSAIAAALGAGKGSIPSPRQGTHPRSTGSTIQAVDGPGLKKAIADQRGKVVLVNLWATWCPPCREEFPDLVRLHNTYRKRGLVILGVAIDEPETQKKVRPFLLAQKCSFPAFVRKKGDVDAFISAVDTGWSGAVPVTYLFDREGKPVGRPMLGAQSYLTLATAVATLLGGR